MIQWTSEFSMGIPRIDKQHQFLFSAINEFYSSLKIGVPKENLYKLIEKLAEYTQIHFADEEKLLQEVGYLELAEHKKQHAFFVEAVTEFLTKYKEGKLLISLEVTGFIKDWITNHILTEDKKYVNYLK